MATRTSSGLVLLFGLLGAAVIAPAQASWLRNLNPNSHGFCCGPKGDLSMNDAMALETRILGDFESPMELALPLATTASESNAPAPAPTPAPAPRSETVKPIAKADSAGVYQVTFDHLGDYEFVAPPDESKAEEAENQIPAPVRALNAKKVSVTGFMLPVKMSEGLVTEFLLVKDQSSCCFGMMPRVNEWVVVKMNGKGVPPLMDIPITFEGTLKVGQMYEGGYLVGLYLLQGERRVES